ncbi:metallophosphatase family protein [Aquibacillus sp. 3ASR75-11]|uniref:Metallophosphatase family protein n=1 Tax=Terrihalobacillus insolitus TaxID=2950438 RepID=A0A9X4AN10_9BACI|nr:metallophosphoesterase family protein [Terrihalobacillus insolitus]MDC3414158.1 metallophosphatase family protein [Terrihalobacillus insolitus]MDC3425364.1 metallophosphatase family protein [Terrihalobacillus insolitus]
MYRIAIVSDIHGNIYALNAVLKDIKEKSVDFIYCLGDMIGIGPFSNEVLNTLFELNNIEVITGNHDESVLAILNNEPYPESRVNVIPHHEWIAERLNSEHISKLENLPRIINTTIYEQSLHLIHYPMKQSLYDEHISKDPFDLTGMPTTQNFSVIDGLNDFSLICFGHDHSKHQFVCNNKTFYNSGSLGCFNEPFARYGVIDIDKNGFNIMQQYVPYEFYTYVNKLRKTNMPRKEIILAIYE